MNAPPAVKALRDDARMAWKAIGKRLKLAPSTAFYLYGCQDTDPETLVIGPRRAVIASLGLAGPRVTELCELDNKHEDLTKGRFFIQDAKTEAGIRDVDMHARLLSELRIHRAQFGSGELDDPAFPTRTGNRRSKDNVRLRIVDPVVARANAIRASRKQPPIHTHVTPHTFRRSYITYVLAAGHDIPYVQSQVGHLDPTVTLAVYAQLIRRPDREQLRQELRAFLDTPLAQADEAVTETVPPTAQIDRLSTGAADQIESLRRIEKAGKGRVVSL